MTEAEFIASIDCQFPYDNEAECCRLCEMGAHISPNAAFMVLHELCRQPRSGNVTTEVLKRILSYWNGCFSHPLAPLLTQIVTTRIEGKELSVNDAMNAMRVISEYPHEYNALAIAYFSCDDVEGKVDDLDESICANWRTQKYTTN
ncbi:MAG: hypothetical protein NTW96_16550 [Planctomycetia bacterium]|nr:hypothetical protein [Planctomycetia bacterium]